MIRVSPTEPMPTHHISLKDRYGKRVGLILCDEKGEPIKNQTGVFVKTPVDTTAMKQTSGSSSYNDYEYPYSPIVQDNLSGGRGGLDFERDSTKYYDSYRTRSGRENKAYLGPQEQYTSGLRSQDQNTPGNVKWHKLIDTQRYIYRRFQASNTYTAGMIWLLVRRAGTPSDLTIKIYSDSAGTVDTELTSVTVPYTRTADLLSEWICETISASLTSGSYYWIVAYASSSDTDNNHWKLAIRSGAGSTYTSSAYDTTPTSANFDLYYRVTTANSDKACIQFEYKEAQYFAISGTTGAPNLYIAGDRGTAQANTGQLGKLIDSAKNWSTNEWAGFTVKIIDGTGSAEPTPYRIITSNDATSLTLSSDWTITHDTTTEYVIYGTKLTEITGHGLTAPVTDVLVTTTGIILFAQGDSTNIRRAKFETSAGAWTPSYADDGTNKATLLDYMPKNKKIVKTNNRDASSNVSIATADPVDWATASHTFGAAVNIDSKYIRITGTAVYPDSSGVEALWIFKEDMPYIYALTGNPYPLQLPEMKTVRSPYNGKNPLVNNVYLYFPLGYGLERYYSNSIDDMGPNVGEGLPSDRRGNIEMMLGYPGKFFVAVDAGTSGYSCIMDSGGYHERYRAPRGQRIKSIGFQVVPGTSLDRMWIFQGNDLIWLPFPSDTTNELEDSNYRFSHECAVTLSRMHAGLFDVMKLVKLLKIQSENLSSDEQTGDPICWMELDYRRNDDENWTTIKDVFTTSPTQSASFSEIYGLAGKRIQFRIRMYTTDATQTPVFIAIIVNAVLRTDVKYMYGPVNFRAMDMERSLQPGEMDEYDYGMDKVKQIEDWADASTDSMLLMESTSALFHNRLVFLNVPNTRQIAYKTDASNAFQKDVFICTVSFQEA